MVEQYLKVVSDNYHIDRMRVIIGKMITKPYLELVLSPPTKKTTKLHIIHHLVQWIEKGQERENNSQ